MMVVGLAGTEDNIENIRKMSTENLKSKTSEKPQISGSKKPFQGA